MSVDTAPWSVSADEMPADGSPAAQFEFLIRYAILAPSSHNSQPWRFVVDEGGVDVYADGGRWLPVADPDRREWYISVGCALENLLVAAERFGFEHDLSYFPRGVPDTFDDSPDDTDVYVARVVLSPGGSASALRGGLFGALTARSTNHGPFHGELTPATREALTNAVVDPDVWVRVVTDDETKASVGGLTTRADRRQFANPAYRRELGRWLGNGALAPSWLKAKLGQLVVTHLDVGDRQAATDSVLVESAPAVVVLGSTTDTPGVRVRVGQTFERLALTATVHGLSVHPMSQALELPDLRTALADTLDASEGVVQHLFRLGYANESEPKASRRPLSAVVR